MKKSGYKKGTNGSLYRNFENSPTDKKTDKLEAPQAGSGKNSKPGGKGK